MRVNNEKLEVEFDYLRNNYKTRIYIMQIKNGSQLFNIYVIVPVCKLQVSFVFSKYMTTSKMELIHASIVSKLLFRWMW